MLDPAPATERPRRLLCDGSFGTAVLTTANSALGAGVLAFPVAFRDAGLVGGSILLLVIGAAASVGLRTVLHCMSRAQAMDPSVKDYTKMVSAAFGTKAEVGVTVLILLYLFGACWGYLVLLADTAAPLVLKADPRLDEALARTLVQVCASVLCVGLCSLRSINTLKYSSAVSVAAVLTMVFMLVKNYAAHPCELGDCTAAPGPSDWCPAGECSGWCTGEQLARRPELCPGGTEGVSAWPADADQLLRALPLVAFALQCHIQGPAVYTEMPRRLQSSPAAHTAVALASSLVLIALYLPTGLAGYAAFGALTQGDVLTNFSTDDPLADVARGCIAVTALCAYPMQHFPARIVLHNAWAALLRRARCAGAPLAVDDAAAGTLPLQAPRAADDAAGGTLPLQRARGAPLGQPAAEQGEPLLPPSGEPSDAFILAEAAVWCALVLCVSLAAAGSSLSGVFSLVGALCGGNVIFTIPGALWLKLGEGSQPRRLLLAGPLIAIGALITVFGTYATIQQMVTGSR